MSSGLTGKFPNNDTSCQEAQPLINAHSTTYRYKSETRVNNQFKLNSDFFYRIKFNIKINLRRQGV